VIVVADSSPLIILAKLSVFALLPKLYPRISIATEVYTEVVVAGAGLPVGVPSFRIFVRRSSNS
jgi:predicted nucleic acid-binding protein